MWVKFVSSELFVGLVNLDLCSTIYIHPDTKEVRYGFPDGREISAQGIPDEIQGMLKAHGVEGSA